MGGCWRPLHRWLQVQRYAWLITKELQSSDKRSSPFLFRARRQKDPEQRAGAAIHKDRGCGGVWWGVGRVNRHGNEQRKHFALAVCSFIHKLSLISANLYLFTFCLHMLCVPVIILPRKQLGCRIALQAKDEHCYRCRSYKYSTLKYSEMWVCICETIFYELMRDQVGK